MLDLVDMGDHVVLINTRKVVLTSGKWDKKLYRHHTGYVDLVVWIVPIGLRKGLFYKGTLF